MSADIGAHRRRRLTRDAAGACDKRSGRRDGLWASKVQLAGSTTFDASLRLPPAVACFPRSHQ
jgi:hypothetical protein